MHTPRTGRKRRLAAYGLFTAAAIVAVIWFVSRWWVVGFESGTRTLSISRGVLYAQTDPAGTHPRIFNNLGWHFYKTDECTWTWRFKGGPPYQKGPNVIWTTTFVYDRYESNNLHELWWAMWSFPIWSGAAGACLWLWGTLARRRVKDYCACGYSLAGLTAQACCPECGRIRHGRPLQPAEDSCRHRGAS